MAAVQRKLVHKQFNSPMGLYSQDNVKATLNRELKAFGAEGIEIDDQIAKPLNLANSAVLRAVEEEEQQQIKCDFYAAERPSRTRQREGVILPPHHAPHQQLLDQIKTHYLSHQQDITVDRDTVMKINRWASKRNLLKRDHSWPPQEVEASQVLELNQVPQAKYSIEALREKFNSPTRIVEPNAKQVREQRQREGKPEKTLPPVKKTELIFQQSPVDKGFSAPETKAADVDLGLVAPRCEYYEQLATTPRSKRQAYSLERGRARKRNVALAGATELPPPKPRSAATFKPKVQRRCIKLATELKISYDNEADSEEEPKVGLDLEDLPLPATPATAAAASKRMNSSTTVIDKQQQQLTKSQMQPLSSPNTHIIPVQVEATRGQLQQISAQQIYDDACTYLKDQAEQEMPAAQDAATYVSTTGGIKLLKRQSSKSAPAPPTPPPPPPPPPPAPLRSKSTATEDVARRQGRVYSLKDPETEPKGHLEIAQLEAKYAHIQQSIAEHLRQIDTYMENAKTALQRSVQKPPTPPPAQPTPPNETWDLFAFRQSPILAVESPLQAILRQIYCRAAGITKQKVTPDLVSEQQQSEEVVTENVPIVERALEDLHRIALALDKEEEQQHLLNVELKTTPAADQAQHVVIEEGEEQDTEYKHVSDVIANYEHLSTAQSCSHEDLPHTVNCCSICGESRGSPNNWSKLNKADQWRLANLQNEKLENYQATYEIRSPYISRQISWEDTQPQTPQTPQASPEKSTNKFQRQRSFVEIITSPATDHLQVQEVVEPLWERSRSPSPLPSRKYPLPLIEAPQRSSSPFGLNPVQLNSSSSSPLPPLEAKFSHISQLEGHNIGLLVKTATEPLQFCMSASSSMLAGTPPATPPSKRRPLPYEFPLPTEEFKSLASSEELPQATREFNFNRSYDNVSPRPYIGIEGYKRVAWPPASEERIVREFTPQPQGQSPAPGSGGYYPQSAAPAPAPAATQAAPAQP